MAQRKLNSSPTIVRTVPKGAQRKNCEAETPQAKKLRSKENLPKGERSEQAEKLATLLVDAAPSPPR